MKKTLVSCILVALLGGMGYLMSADNYTALSVNQAINILAPLINAKQATITGNTNQLTISGATVTVKNGALLTNMVFTMSDMAAIGATNAVLMSDGTTNLMVWVGGVLVSNIAGYTE